MRMPMTPPTLQEILNDLQPDRLSHAVVTTAGHIDGYLHWDDLRYKTPPGDLTSDEWWAVLKLGRLGQRRTTPLVDKNGQPFTYAMPDEALRLLHAIDRDVSGNITLSEDVTGSAKRNRYIRSSLIEEAITSSQLEGASTTRKVAKEMITSGRGPRTKSERMILNNYVAMERVREIKDTDFSRALLEEIHRIVTEGTLRDPSLEGSIQSETDVRVAVHAIDDERQILHDPPPASELPRRIELMCQFANDDPSETDDTRFVHPVIRAIILHFWIGYDHPFEDGNGRTARAMFYWSMLHNDYWLAEYLTISKVLKDAPGQYARAFLHTETDENDLTYFILHQLRVIRRSIADLHIYMQRTMTDMREARVAIRQDARLNHRQVELLNDARQKPGKRYSIRGHMTRHGIVYQTARTDLLGLVERDLLTQSREGRAFVFIAPDDLAERLQHPPTD